MTDANQIAEFSRRLRGLGEKIATANVVAAMELETAAQLSFTKDLCTVVEGLFKGLGEVIAAFETTDQEDSNPIADAAFMGRMGLKVRLEELRDALKGTDVYRLLDICGAARLESLRVIAEVERGLSSMVSAEQRVSILENEIRDALDLRIAYARFFDECQGLSQNPDPVAQVRSGANLLAILIGRNTFASARMNDRRLLHELRERIRAWFVSYRSGSPDAVTEARRLFRDYLNVAECLMGINHRAELCVADKRALTIAMETLQRRADDDTLSLEERQDMRVLIGRDMSLSALIQSKTPVDVKSLRSEVTRVMGTLGMNNSSVTEGF